MTEQINPEAVEAAARAIWRNAERDIAGSIDRESCDRVARRAIRATLPYLARVAPDERTIRIAARQAHPELDGLSIARHDAFVAGARWATSAQERGPRRPGFPWEQATREPWPDDDETEENNHGK